MKTFKIRFIKEKGQYTLQIKNCFGIWRTQVETIHGNGGFFYQPYSHKDKDSLLTYVILTDYWTKRKGTVLEYPTIEKYQI